MPVPRDLVKPLNARALLRLCFGGWPVSIFVGGWGLRRRSSILTKAAVLHWTLPGLFFGPGEGRTWVGNRLHFCLASESFPKRRKFSVTGTKDVSAGRITTLLKTTKGMSNGAAGSGDLSWMVSLVTCLCSKLWCFCCLRRTSRSWSGLTPQEGPFKQPPSPPTAQQTQTRTPGRFWFKL